MEITAQKRISTMAEDVIDQIWHRPKKLRNKMFLEKLTWKITHPNGKKFYQIKMKKQTNKQTKNNQSRAFPLFSDQK